MDRTDAPVGRRPARRAAGKRSNVRSPFLHRRVRQGWRDSEHGAGAIARSQVYGLFAPTGPGKRSCFSDTP